MPPDPLPLLCPAPVTLVTPDAFEPRSAVAGARDVVTRGVVHTLTELLAAVTEGARCAPCAVRGDG